MPKNILPGYTYGVKSTRNGGWFHCRIPTKQQRIAEMRRLGMSLTESPGLVKYDADLKARAA
eukprot:953456-Prymnesium_polylepis.1